MKFNTQGEFISYNIDKIVFITLTPLLAFSSSTKNVKFIAFMHNLCLILFGMFWS